MPEIGIEDLPLERVYERLVYPQIQSSVGQTFRIVQLRTARGSQFNGRLCRVLDFDRDLGDARLHCQLLSSEWESSGGEEATNGRVMIKVKCGNLRSLDMENNTIEHFMEQTPLLSDDKLLECLQKVIQQNKNVSEDGGRADLLYRLGLCKGLIQKIIQSKEDDGAELSDSDYCFPCGAGGDRLTGNFGIVMTKTKPACWGNGFIDMRRVNIGLDGDDTTECSVCQEIMVSGGAGGSSSRRRNYVTLPCLHVFHEECIVNWLDSNIGQRNWNFPTCRKVVPNDMSTYRVNYDRHVQVRVNEYPLSGFCTKCMIMIMENNRNEALGYDDGNGTLRVGL